MWQQTLKSQIGKLPIIQNQAITFVLDFSQPLHKALNRLSLRCFNLTKSVIFFS